MAENFIGNVFFFSYCIYKKNKIVISLYIVNSMIVWKNKVYLI